MLAYDLHGTWDKASKFVGPFLAPHSNITEIDLGLDLLWRAGVKPTNVIMGQGWYGRSFTLADPSCNKPNSICQFSDAAKPGPISNAAGILIDTEIFEIVKSNNLQPTWDKTAGVKWVSSTPSRFGTKIILTMNRSPGTPISGSHMMTTTHSSRNETLRIRAVSGV